MKISLFLLISFTAFSWTIFGQNSEALKQMVETERAFAAMAAEKGTNPAFVEYAAPNGLVFTDKPTNARELYGDRPANNSLLAWAPNFAGISSTGELGFTTGNWSFHPQGKTDAATAFGEFASVWKRQADGKYKFVVDTGIQHAKPIKHETDLTQASFLAAQPATNSGTTNWQNIENEFSAALKKNGVVRTYEKLLAENSRLLRENHFPFVGKKEATKAFAAEKLNFVFRPLSGELSGDLAYSYGEYELTDATKKTEKGHYLRVWKQDRKDWRIALEILHPTPPARN